MPLPAKRFAIFHGSDTVGEFVFEVANGLLALQEYVEHTPQGRADVDSGLYWLPPDVAIAAGKEAKRRR